MRTCTCPKGYPVAVTTIPYGHAQTIVSHADPCVLETWEIPATYSRAHATWLSEVKTAMGIKAESVDPEPTPDCPGCYQMLRDLKLISRESADIAPLLHSWGHHYLFGRVEKLNRRAHVSIYAARQMGVRGA